MRYSIYDKGYFIGAKKSAYLNYLDQEKIFDTYWKKYITRYGKTASLKVHLDIGCGYGVLVKKMLEYGWRSYGIDISEFAIMQGRKFYGDIDIRLATSDKLPFPNDEFGYMTCLDVIEHLSDEEINKTTVEMYRCLKPGGIIFLATPNVYDNCLIDVNSERYIEKDVTHINYKSSHDLYHLFKKVNFSKVIIKGSSPYIPQITELSIKKGIAKKLLNRFLSKVLYRFIGTDIAYSTYLFAIVQK